MTSECVSSVARKPLSFLVSRPEHSNALRGVIPPFPAHDAFAEFASGCSEILAGLAKAEGANVHSRSSACTKGAPGATAGTSISFAIYSADSVSFLARSRSSAKTTSPSIPWPASSSWLAPMLATVAAFVVSRYRRQLAQDSEIRKDACGAANRWTLAGQVGSHSL